jgi:hypothetical protein
MAIRKATMREQVAQAIAQTNPGDRPLVTLHSVTGSSPYLINSLGLVGQLFVKYYFITVTEQAVVFHAAGRVGQKPKDLVAAIPRAQAQGLVSDVRLNTVWSSFRFRFPDQEKPTRINVFRQWRAELEQLIPAITGVPMGR